MTVDPGSTLERAKPRLRGVLHQGGFLVSLVTGTVLVMLARGARPTVAAAVYAASAALLFGTSAAYHRGPWSARARAAMQRLDHSMIFVLIAGTYTPFALLVLHGAARWTVLSLVWAGAAAGVVSQFRPARSRWLVTAPYLALGGVAVLLVPSILSGAGVAVLTLVVLGGACYIVGGVVYARRRPDPVPDWFGFHEVFHAFTLVAFACFYVAVSLTVHGATA